MKILISENRQRQLAYKMLDEKLSGLTRKDININKESVLSNWQVLFIDNDNNILMRWNEKNETLYVSSDFVIPLRLFSFDDEELYRLITWWFTNRIRLEPEEMYIVAPGSLDWEDMGLEGLMGEF